MKIFNIRAARVDKQLEASARRWTRHSPRLAVSRAGAAQPGGAEGKLLPVPGRGQGGPAAVGWNQLINQLQKLKNDARLKDHYFECYFQLVNSLVQAALLPNATKKDDYLRQAAKLIIDLEASAPDFGGKTSKDRFDDLLKNTADLKLAYEQMKKPAGQ
jgi:hypothetical protein